MLARVCSPLPAGFAAEARARMISQAARARGVGGGRPVGSASETRASSALFRVCLNQPLRQPGLSPPLQRLVLNKKIEVGRYLVELPLVKVASKALMGLIESEEPWSKLCVLFFPFYQPKDFSVLLSYRCEVLPKPYASAKANTL
jgi:hypothetical protein